MQIMKLFLLESITLFMYMTMILIDMRVSIGKYVMLLILNTIMKERVGKGMHQEDVGEDILMVK